MRSDTAAPVVAMFTYRRSYLVRRYQTYTAPVADVPADAVTAYLGCGDFVGLDEWMCDHGTLADDYTSSVENDDLDGDLFDADGAPVTARPDPAVGDTLTDGHGAAWTITDVLVGDDAVDLDLTPTAAGPVTSVGLHLALTDLTPAGSDRWTTILTW